MEKGCASVAFAFIGFGIGAFIALASGMGMPTLLSMFLPFLLGGLGIYLGALVDRNADRANEAAAKAKESSEAEELTRRHGLDEVVVNSDNGAFIGINWNSHLIVSGAAGLAPRLRPFDSLADVELEIDRETFSEDESVTTTSRSSQIIGAAAGGVLFGPAGAVVGGLTGKQTTTGTSSNFQIDTKYTLRLRYRDRQEPLAETEFYSRNKGLEYSFKGAERLRSAQRFHAHLSNILDGNGRA